MKKLLLVLLFALAACSSVNDCAGLAKPDLVENKVKAQYILNCR